MSHERRGGWVGQGHVSADDWLYSNMFDPVMT